MSCLLDIARRNSPPRSLRHARAWWWFTLLFTLGLVSAGARAEGPALELGDRGPYLPDSGLEVLEDASARMTLADVRASQAFVPAPSAAPNYGFTDSAYWFRLRVKNVGTARDFYVEFAYPHVDHVSLYRVDAEGAVHEAHGGDALPFHVRAIAHQSINFALPLAPGEAQTLYVRVAGEGSVQVPISIWSTRAFAESKLNEAAELFMYYGIVLVMILYNVFLYVGFRDPNYLYYVCYLLSFVMYQLTLNGLAYQYLWPNAPHFENRVVVPFGLLTGVFLTTFSRRFLQTRRNVPKLDKVLLFFIALFAVQLPMSLLLSPRLNLKLMTASAFTASLFVPICGVVCLARGYRPARFFVLAFMAFFTGVTTAVAQSFGALRGAALSFDTMQIGSAVEVVLLSLALADRIKSEQAAYQGHIERLNAALIEKERARTTFFHNTSHELRTPLNGILAFVDLLAKGQYGELTERARGQLRKVESLARSLLFQVNAILDLAKSRNGQLQLSAAPLPLGELLDEAHAVAEGLTLKDRGRTFTLKTSWDGGTPPSFVSDREKLATVMRNLLGNAFKFADGRRPNHVTLQLALSSDRKLTIRISDTGIGIAERDQKRIFEEFAQVDEASSRRRYEGSGLGLALVDRIVQLMGGEVRLESKLSEGTTVTVEVPELRATGGIVTSEHVLRDLSPSEMLQNVPSSPPARYTRMPLHALPANQNGRIARVLVVDDNEINAEVVRDVLSTRGYEIEHASRGDLALERMRRQVPDLVLLDLMMPGMSGEDVLSAMKESPTLCNVPVLVLTARASEEDRVMALQLGADDYLAKPLLGEELVLRVHNTLARLDLVKALAERKAVEASLATAQKVLTALGREGALVPNVALAEFYQSAESASGDWFGVSYDAARNRLFTLIGDVTGHGMTSALVTVAASGAAKGCLSALRDGREDTTMAEALRILCRAVNQAVRDAAEGHGRTMTMAFLCVDLDSGEGVYLNAGHNEVYLRQEGGVTVLLEAGEPLGGAPEIVAGTRDFRLGEGDALFLHTDGLVENTGPAGQTLGRRALKRILTDARPPEELKQALLAACRRIWCDEPPADDCAFLAVRREPPKPTSAGDVAQA